MTAKKQKRIKSAKHLSWVRTLTCCADSLSCAGEVQAHHLLKPWVGSRGMSLKADDRNVIPLCLYHHGVLHTKHGSEKSFFYAFGRDEDFGKGLAKFLWEKSPVNWDKNFGEKQ